MQDYTDVGDYTQYFHSRISGHELGVLIESLTIGFKE
jgi:hypothetical protein